MMIHFKPSIALVFCLFPLFSFAQKTFRLKPAQVFDGEIMHKGWEVLVKGNKIVAVGAPASIKSGFCCCG
jgi:hypothetical protein